MDLTNNFAWINLLDIATNNEDTRNIKELKGILDISEARFLFNTISKFENPEEIKVIEGYQNKQHKLGAWVSGIYPDQFIDQELTIPDSFSNKTRLVLELARQKEKNLEAIRATGEYNLHFEDNELSLSDNFKDIPAGWHLEIDLTVLAETLKFLQADRLSESWAEEIANLEGNQEMLKHRKNLGYLPEPITDREDLIELLTWAASNKPADIIWKWLSPINIFELADIYNKLVEFEFLLDSIENKRELICNRILAEINQYIDFDLSFAEIFSLTIGFAIRGWATDNRFGVNIENIKDNYNLLLATIGHELFHRLQTKICAPDSQSENFSEIVNGDFKDGEDNKFYTVLSYIMLEGTGEFITDQFLELKQDNLKAKAVEGFDLLENIYEVIYIEGDLGQVDDLLAKGLKSNGIFYSLGKFLTERLISFRDKTYLGIILKKGALDFFIEGFKATEIVEENKLITKLNELKKGSKKSNFKRNDKIGL